MGSARRKMAGVAVGAALALCGFAQVASCGETSVYLKSGWFTWDEKVDGAEFVSESGLMYGAGVARKDDLAPFTVGELLEVWGGSLEYDGHDVTRSVTIKTDTAYIGTKEEVALSLNIQAGEGLTIEPLAGLGHKFWVRTRSSEDWNTFYGKAGAGAEYAGAGATYFVKGGGLFPIYTRSHASLSDAGFTDVVTEPESEVSGFAEGGVRLREFAISVEYEGMRFGDSKKVTTRRTTPTASGIVVVENHAFQPGSSSGRVSLKITYYF